MASLGHVAVGLAAARAYGVGEPDEDRDTRIKRMVVFGVLSLLPDADVVGFRFGIPYGSPFGHRGFTHSMVVALVVSFAGAWVASRRASPPERWRRARKLFVYLLFVVGSHGLLDMLTDGGKGVATFWPFSSERLFFPWRPLPVAPIGVRILSPRGLRVMAGELLVFAPFWIYALVPRSRTSSLPK